MALKSILSFIEEEMKMQFAVITTTLAKDIFNLLNLTYQILYVSGYGELVCFCFPFLYPKTWMKILWILSYQHWFIVNCSESSHQYYFHYFSVGHKFNKHSDDITSTIPCLEVINKMNKLLCFYVLINFDMFDYFASLIC